MLTADGHWSSSIGTLLFCTNRGSYIATQMMAAILDCHAGCTDDSVILFISYIGKHIIVAESAGPGG